MPYLFFCNSSASERRLSINCPKFIFAIFKGYILIENLIYLFFAPFIFRIG